MMLSQCCDAHPSYPDLDPPAICSKCKEHSGFRDDGWESLPPREREFSGAQQAVIDSIIENNPSEEGPRN